MSGWTPEIVRFMEDAACASDYFQRLARVVTAGLPQGASVCDAGCGMGQLACEMARLGFNVDALDKSAAAVRYARSLSARSEHGERVHVRVGDFSEGGGPSCDRMVFCLSASVRDAFWAARTAGAKSLVVVNKVHARVEYGDEYLGSRPVVRDAQAEYDDVRACGIVGSVRELEFEYGQPFRSLEDARCYFGLFRTRKYPLGVTDAELERELVRTGDGRFPWYLPVSRRLSIFDIDIQESERNANAGGLGFVTRSVAAKRIA